MQHENTTFHPWVQRARLRKKKKKSLKAIAFDWNCLISQENRLCQNRIFASIPFTMLSPSQPKENQVDPVTSLFLQLSVLPPPPRLSLTLDHTQQRTNAEAHAHRHARTHAWRFILRYRPERIPPFYPYNSYLCVPLIFDKISGFDLSRTVKKALLFIFLQHAAQHCVQVK